MVCHCGLLWVIWVIPHFSVYDKYTVLGILVIFIPDVSFKSGSQPLQLPVFSFQHKILQNICQCVIIF